jgi:hypothetical protein
MAKYEFTVEVEIEPKPQPIDKKGDQPKVALPDDSAFGDFMSSAIMINAAQTFQNMPWFVRSVNIK